MLHNLTPGTSKVYFFQRQHSCCRLPHFPAIGTSNSAYNLPASDLVPAFAMFSGQTWSRGLPRSLYGSQRQIWGSLESLIPGLPDSERLVLVTSALPFLDLKMRSRPI